jgi:hypothetical protein
MKKYKITIKLKEVEKAKVYEIVYYDELTALNLIQSYINKHSLKTNIEKINIELINI